MPDRLPSLILLVAFWIPPAVVGRAAAELVHRSTRHVRPALIYTGLAAFVLGWSAAWFLFNLSRMPPYIPGATRDPTYAPPEAVAGLAVVTMALVLPVSAIACVLAFRSRGRSLGRTSAALSLTIALLSCIVSQAGAQSSPSSTSMPAAQSPVDSLLDRLVGNWRMVGQVRGRPVTYALTARRVLNGRYVELHMIDVSQPPQYEARVFIGADTVPGKVLVHWLDSFGAAFSVPAANGYARGDTLRFEFAYSTGPFRDTFVYRPSADTWMFRLESSAGSGEWRLFADYEVRRSSSGGRSREQIMSYEEDVKLLEKYMPLISKELRRIGVSEEDERWIHAGTNQRPTRELAEANLAALKALPTGMGVRAYCRWLGFDYDEMKRRLSSFRMPNEEL